MVGAANAFAIERLETTMRRLSILCLLLIFLIPSYAQEGQGIIREGIANDLGNIGSLNPLRCDNSTCFWAVQRIFPRLLAFDPETRWYGEGTTETASLAVSWDISDDNKVYTFHLREDAFWTDGSPITAYDYFYSYLAIMSRDFDSPYFGRLDAAIEGVVPLSDNDLVIIFKENDCDVLQNIYFPIAPAHAFDSSFAETSAAFFTDGDAREQWAAWEAASDYNFGFMRETPFDMNPGVTGGVFDFVAYQPYGYIRLQKGELAFELLPVLGDDERVNLFLNGDLTMLRNPPLNRWSDISAADDVQLFQTPTNRWDYIAFNLEHPIEPENAFDEDGNPIAQEPNLFFSDSRVREAIQLAINVPELIEVGLHGRGTQLAGLFSPVSWVYDENLSPYPYDPERARDLLDEAGWIQAGNNRICVDCGTAPNGTNFYFGLGYGNDPHHAEVATLIARQLSLVGLSAYLSGSNFDHLIGQRFDLYLGTWEESLVPGGLEDLFTPQADIVGEGWNFGSYNNPNLTSLLEDAQTVAGCGLEERISRYQSAQTLLQQELPYVWLYAHDERIAVSGSVQNFAPTLGRPLENLLDWRIFDVPRG
jgi:peptide/nickel transport system substrate-binding protein